MGQLDNSPRGEHLDPNQDEGKTWVHVEHISPSPIDKFWAIAGDFAAVQKWMPGGEDVTVTVVEEFGKRNEPGCIRRVESTRDGQILRLEEKLVVLKDEEYFLKYTIVDGGWVGKLFGVTDYIATMKVEPVQGKEGCVVHWSAEMKFTKSESKEQAIHFFHNIYDVSLKNMDACASALPSAV